MKSKGFTLIELLVVVAIIGILATVVLASLGSARTQSKDAAIKQIVSQMRAQAELQYDGDYDGICNSGQFGKMFESAVQNSLVTIGGSLRSRCYDSSTFRYTDNSSLNITPANGFAGSDSNGSPWAVSIALNTTEHICIDSTGTLVITPGPLLGHSSAGADKTC